MEEPLVTFGRSNFSILFSSDSTFQRSWRQLAGKEKRNGGNISHLIERPAAQPRTKHHLWSSRAAVVKGLQL